MRRLAAAAVLTVLTMALGWSPASAAGSTAALWHLDEPAGATTMADSSGNGNSGTVSHVNTDQQGAFGAAYGFSGGGSMVTVPSADSLNPGAANIDLSLYMNVSALLPLGDYNVIQKGLSTTVGGQYKMEIGGTSARLGRPICSFTGSIAAARVAAKVSVADGSWHHVECVKTATSIGVLVDGVSAGSTLVTVGSIANSAALTLGAKSTGDDWFQGSLDEVGLTFS